MRKIPFLSLLFFIAMLRVFGQDYYLGGSVQISTPLEIDLVNFENSNLHYSLSTEPFIAGGFEFMEYYASLNFGINDDIIPEINDFEAYATLYIGDYFSIKAGRFIFSPSMALLLSKSNFFTASNWLALLQGNFDKTAKAANLVQGTVFIHDFYIRLTWEPYATLTSLPDSNSIWFPGGTLPQKIIFAPVTSEDGAVLRNVSVTEEQVDLSLKNNGAMIEFGGFLGPVDFGISYFHGLDRVYVYNASFTFDALLPIEEYDAEVIGSTAVIDAFALNTAYSISDFTFWSEFTFTLNKPYITGDLIKVTSQTESAHSLYLTATAGTMYQFYTDWVFGFLAAEYTQGWYFDEATEDYYPPLSQIFGGVLETSWFEGKMGLRGSVLVDYQKWSVAHVYTISYHPLENFELSLTAPFFHGVFRSEFGQYSENHLATIRINWSF